MIPHPRCLPASGVLLFLALENACSSSPPPTPDALPLLPPERCATAWTLPWPSASGEIRWEDCFSGTTPYQQVILRIAGEDRWSHTVGRAAPCTDSGWWTSATATPLLLPGGSGRVALEIRGHFGALTCPSAPHLEAGPTRLILLPEPDLPLAPMPTCSHQRPLPRDTSHALWVLEDHRLGAAHLSMTLDIRAEDGLWVRTPPRSTGAPSSFLLDEEEADRPNGRGFPVSCPAATDPHATLVMPLLAMPPSLEGLGLGQRGRVLAAPAAVRQAPSAEGALLAILPPGATVAVQEVTATLRAIPGTGEGHPDVRVRLPDGREGWVHGADMAISAAPRPEGVGGPESGLWLASQEGREWWGKLADFERPLSTTWLVGPEAAVPIAHRSWTGSAVLRASHVMDANQDGQPEVLVVAEEHVPESGRGDWLLTVRVAPTLAQQGAWRLPVPHRSGLVIRHTGQARLSEGVLVLDTVDLRAVTLERLTVYLDDPSRAPETERLPVQATVRAAGRAQAAPSAEAPGQGQLWEGEAVTVVAVQGGPLDAWRQPAWVQIAQGWIQADKLVFADSFLAVTLAGEEDALEDFPWAQFSVEGDGEMGQ